MIWSKQRLAETIALLRWALPVLISLAVIGHQIFQTFALNHWGPFAHLSAGILVYGLGGSLITWWTLTWISRNLAEKERAGEKSREHEQYLASITAASADAIISLDAERVIQSWNRGAELIFGYTEEEIVGHPFSVLVPEELKEKGELELLTRSVEEKGFVQNYETERIAKEGRRVIVDLTMTLLTDKEGKVIGSSAILRDITVRKKVEAEIRELNREGLTCVLVEQNVALSLKLADRAYVLENGRVTLSGAGADLLADDRVRQAYLGM